jgi:Bacterial Ig-like domain
MRRSINARRLATTGLAWITASAASVIAGCSSNDATDKVGPPEILQVFVRERVAGHDAEGNGTVDILPRLAYGDHPDISTKDDDRKVTAAVAKDGQRLRVVVDRLLKGNAIEEVPCKDGTWSRIPDGMDYNGVAKCAGADLSHCEGLCIGPGGPVGILDENQDGAIDATRLIEGAVVMTCNGTVIPLDAERSYYQPAGSQDIPASGPDTLGPAIAITTADGMPPGAHCGLSFGEAVTGKHGDRMCAPGAAGCTPGDTSAIGWDVEPFLIAETEPADGDSDVALTDDMSSDATVKIHLNAPIDDASLAAAITITANGVAVTTVTPSIDADDDSTVDLVFASGFAPSTTYVVSVTSGAAGVHDTYADSLAADTTFTWITK